MSDDYPREWVPWITHDEPPTIGGRPLSSLRTGLGIDLSQEPPDDDQLYPSHWRPTH